MGQAKQRQLAGEMPYQQAGFEVKTKIQKAKVELAYKKAYMPDFDPSEIWDMSGASVSAKELRTLIVTPNRPNYLIGFHVTDEKNLPDILANGLKPNVSYVGFAAQKRDAAIWLQMGYPVLPHCYDDFFPHIKKPVILMVETKLDYERGMRRFVAENIWQGVQLAVQKNEITKLAVLPPELVKEFRNLNKDWMSDGLASESDQNGFWHRLAKSVH